MLKKLYILFFITGICYGQTVQFEQEQYPFPVMFYDVEPQLGFTQALSYYHHDFGDLDNDGDMDIILGSGTWEYYMGNTGNPSNPSYQIITNQIVTPFSTSTTYQAPCFCDIDNDSDLDIFIGDKYGPILFFENFSTPDSMLFILVDSAFVDLSTSKPTLDFVDIDGDDDFDLFLGIGWTPATGVLYFYRNNGTPQMPDMILESEYFESIDVGDNASPEFCDIDNDGDYDLFIGCENGTVWYYENIGDSVNYDFEYMTNFYGEIDVGNMSVPRFCDIDADGDYDLFVGNESAGYTNGFEGDIIFYRNIGTPDSANFEFVTAQYLFMDMSASSGPVICDIDNDGLTELLVGILGGQIVKLENSGTLSEPEFYFADTSCFNLTFPYQPEFAFGDLDNDGDMDIVVSHGSFLNYVRSYRNIGSTTSPEYELWETIESSYMDYIFWGVDFVDIDGDEDLDLFYGYGDNLIKYWENVGNIYSPRFVLQEDNYLNQTPYYGQTHPRFGDLDHDGDYDLIIGRYKWWNPGYQGNLLEYWENTGSQNNAVFISCDTIAEYLPPVYLDLRPYLSDMDDDGDLDIICGEYGGAMLFYRNLANPLQVTVTISIQGSDVILTWSDVSNAAEYRIFYQDIPYFTPSGTPQVTVFPPDTSWVDYGALGEGKRYYRMVVSE
ncbi:MAG: VCBS repeat-containing protein [candidate division Zixibacteria bacterium]|nr:VCBS repeat-containing protein [Candidatus Tariuqbacter arcticus]